MHELLNLYNFKHFFLYNKRIDYNIRNERKLQMDIIKQFYDAAVNLKYYDIKVYNYLQTSIDTLTFLADTPEKIDERPLFKGTYQGIPVFEDPGKEAKKAVQGFLDSLGKREALFFTSEQFRKEANGKLYHTVLDPYILSLPEGKYSVIECGSGNNSMFYEDVHVWNYDMVRCAYGVEPIDFEDLFAFMEKKTFGSILFGPGRSL